jgi:YjjG family noncanonical pyrimidine nucleotidase
MYKNKIKHIFFDLDHTLWDFDKNSEVAFDKIFKANHPNINTNLFIEKYVPINQACWKLFQNDEITHQELRYNRLKNTFDATDYEISDPEIDKIANDYLDFLPQSNLLFDGAIEILEYLVTKYELHIITNGFAGVQAKKINNSNINHYFKSITNSEMAGVKKPNPKIFEHALEIAKAKKSESIMIGDSLDADVHGAINFGIDAIYFNSNNENATIDVLEIKNLLELKNYF